MTKYLTRRGDGQRIELTADEIMRDLELGTQDAADRGKINPLADDELAYLQDLFTTRSRILGVEPGNEVVLTEDAGCLRMLLDSGSACLGIPMDRTLAHLVNEKCFAMDTLAMGHYDYSFKAVKPLIAHEMQATETALLNTIAPMFYGSMPNLGMYYKPDGAFGNPSDLLPAGKVKEALEAQEEVVEVAVGDMVYIGNAMAEIGCDGFNLDTTGAAGDADYKAALHATEQLKKSHPNLCVEIGMAGEFVLGIHGDLKYDGKRLAGMYPHEQVKVAETAGADIFGPVINTKLSKSTPFNASRAVTFTKACSEAASIPIHANVGMGVGGTPMHETPPFDVVTRVSKALVEIGKADGL